MKTVEELIEVYQMHNKEVIVNGVYIYINNNIVCSFKKILDAYYSCPEILNRVLVKDYYIDSDNDLLIIVNNTSFKQQFNL